MSRNIDQMNLDELRERVRECRECELCRTRSNTVFGEGSRCPPVMFIGEGPGHYEDQSGRPFVGRAGKLLDQMIEEMGLAREEVFIGNIVKCRPPDNRNPSDEEAQNCLPYLRRQIVLLKPRFLILLGAVPLQFMLGLKGITKLHGNFYEYMEIPTMATYHPSYLLRVNSRKREAWEDLQKIMRWMRQ